jgi:hypothetical protein
VSAVEANERYVHAVTRNEDKLADLHEELSLDADLMNVLYLIYLDLGEMMLQERTDPEAVLEARTRGWIAGRRPYLTDDGLSAWWEWKNKITPHLRDVRFQQLWRDVAGW